MNSLTFPSFPSLRTEGKERGDSLWRTDVEPKGLKQSPSVLRPEAKSLSQGISFREGTKQRIKTELKSIKSFLTEKEANKKIMKRIKNELMKNIKKI